MAEETSRPEAPGPLSQDLIAEIAELYRRHKFPDQFLTPKLKRDLQDAYRARVREVYESIFGNKPENSPVLLNDFEQEMEIACKSWLRTH